MIFNHFVKLSSGNPNINNISNKLLKSIINDIAPVLSHIFNKSLITGIVPSLLKIAHVNPIYKSGDKHTFGSFRVKTTKFKKFGTQVTS